MVLLAGPRQAGKTTLAKEIGRSIKGTTYLNYDHAEDRKMIHEEAWLDSTELLILDELHKMPDWKGFLKGIYDTKLDHLKILVTGSARLEVFSQVGDSLAGRYYAHRLLPLSPAELALLNEKVVLDRFLERGGFPEPFLEESETDAKRWRRQYVEALLRGDVLDFDGIQNVRNIRLIFELLRGRVGSPVSYSSIAKDVGIAPNTVKKYLGVLEALYIVFRVTPFSKNIARSLLKEPKIYFFDTGLVAGDSGAQFENLVAVCLLKHVYARVDYHAEEISLNYLRTKDGKEVDFALVRDGAVQRMIEVKCRNGAIGSALLDFHKKYRFPATQVVKELRRERMDQEIEVVSGERFLSNLSL